MPCRPGRIDQPDQVGLSSDQASCHWALYSSKILITASHGSDVPVQQPALEVFVEPLVILVGLSASVL